MNDAYNASCIPELQRKNWVLQRPHVHMLDLHLHMLGFRLNGLNGISCDERLLLAACTERSVDNTRQQHLGLDPRSSCVEGFAIISNDLRN